MRQRRYFPVLGCLAVLVDAFEPDSKTPQSAHMLQDFSNLIVKRPVVVLHMAQRE